MYQVINGDVMTPSTWASIPDQSVHCCVTSPPYYGLRDYGVDGQIGLESTLEEYVNKMVDVFRHVWRVLRDDGTLWLNLGDSYNSGTTSPQKPSTNVSVGNWQKAGAIGNVRCNVQTLKTKDLIGVPWRVAFALQQDGWYLRQDIIWHKPSPMPESCTDRCTKSHEYVFLLTKSPKYFYDADAIREPNSGDLPYGDKRTFKMNHENAQGQHGRSSMFSGGSKEEYIEKYYTNGRNKRSVWTVTSQPYPSAHFATFPPKLIEPMILAGTSQKGCCAKCGEPYCRIVEKKQIKRNRPNDYVKRLGQHGTGNSCSNSVAGVRTETLDWSVGCDCGSKIVPCTVLDPFAGSGTTLQVSAEHNRESIGIELNPQYIKLIEQRLSAVTPNALFS